MTMIGRRATDQGSGGVEWIPCPTGSYRFEVGAGSVRLSPFKDQKGNDQYQVRFALKLGDEEYKRVKEEYGDPPEGAELSGRTLYTCGLTLGWYDRAGAYQSTRLADFLVTLLGSKQQTALRKYLMNGGGPFITPDGSVEAQIAEWETWLAWFAEAHVWGTITHRNDSKVPGKVWADFGGPMAVGQRPGPADPDYEAWGRAKLRMLMGQGNGVVAASDPEPEPEPVPAAYTAQGEPIDTTTGEIDATDDEEATLLAQLEEARKRKAAANREKVAAATGAQTVDNKDYERLFGEPAKA